VERMPDSRKLATEWVTEYRRRGAVIEDSAVAQWIDRVEQQFKESWAARQVERQVDHQLGGVFDTLDQAISRVIAAAERVDN
jgi:hypothetical protein